jgi:hypothetical protein
MDRQQIAGDNINAVRALKSTDRGLVQFGVTALYERRP